MKRHRAEQQQDINATILLLPEIWTIIFLFCGEEWYLTKAVRVSRAWVDIVSCFVTTIGVVEEKWSNRLDDYALQCTPKLRALRTEANWFYVTTDGLRKVSGLTSLELSVHIRNLTSDALTCFESLTYLSCTPQLSLPHKSTNLQTLCISHNNIANDNSLSCFTQLKTLRISGCNQVTPKGLRKLTSLTHLDISKQCAYHRFLPKLTNLTKLITRERWFLDDYSLFRLTKLVTLNLNVTGPVTGRSLSKMPHLTSLQVIGNGSKMCVVASTPDRLHALLNTFYRKYMDIV